MISHFGNAARSDCTAGSTTVTRFTPRPARLTLALLGAVMLSAALAPSAYAQDEAFKKGVDARNDRKWPDVVTQMREEQKTVRQWAQGQQAQQNEIQRLLLRATGPLARGTARAREDERP